MIVHPTMSRVGEEMENVSFETPATLKKAGIPVALQRRLRELRAQDAAGAVRSGRGRGQWPRRSTRPWRSSPSMRRDPRDRQARRLARGRQGRRRGDLRRRPPLELSSHVTGVVVNGVVVSDQPQVVPLTETRGELRHRRGGTEMLLAGCHRAAEHTRDPSATAWQRAHDECSACAGCAEAGWARASV